MFDHKEGLLWSNYADPAESGHHIVLAVLYTTYLGTVSIKALASSFVQWPGTDAGIGRVIKQYCAWQDPQRNSAHTPAVPEGQTKSLGQ